MNDVRTKELMSYLEDCIAVETDIAMQETLISDYEAYADAKKPQKEEPPEPTLEKISTSSKVCLLVRNLALVGFVLAVIVTVILAVSRKDEAGLIVFGGMMAALICLLLSCTAMSEQREAKQKEEENEKKQRQYQDELQCAKQKYEENTEAWTVSSKAIETELHEHLGQTRAVAEKLYASKNLIYAKYNYLAALTSFYEYLSIGRCSELAGSGGVYDLYEDEMRKDTITSELPEILTNLEQIKRNQYLLYQKACEILETTSVIVSELEAIEGYTIDIASLTALNAYYSSLSERNTRISALYALDA